MRNRFELNTEHPLNAIKRLLIYGADERRIRKNQINFQRLLRLFHQNNLYTYWCILHVIFWGRYFLSNRRPYHFSLFTVNSVVCILHCKLCIMRRWKWKAVDVQWTKRRPRAHRPITAISLYILKSNAKHFEWLL